LLLKLPENTRKFSHYKNNTVVPR